MVTNEEWAELDAKIQSWIDWRGKKQQGAPRLACRHCAGWGHRREDGIKLKCSYCDGSGNEPTE